MNPATVKDYLLGLQGRIVAALELLDGKPFREDRWDRPQGGGGISRVIEEGELFERGGVNFSHVQGTGLPPSATASRPELAGRAWEAMGVSLVLHPRNPYCPTVHMNVRFFVAAKDGAAPAWWFGGGMDLTPYYGFAEDAAHFHRTCKLALDPFGGEHHAQFKAWCDDYFFLKHRNEPRGVGGIFFDDSEPARFRHLLRADAKRGRPFRRGLCADPRSAARTRPTASASATSRPTAADATSNSTWSATAAPCSACSRAAAPNPS